MSALQPASNSTRKRFFTPMRVGFVASLIAHAVLFYVLFDKFHQVELAQDGQSSMMLSLAAVQTPSVQDSEISKPKKPKHTKKVKKDKIPEQAQKPQEMSESDAQQDSKLAQQDDAQNGDVIETLNFANGQDNEIYTRIQREINKNQIHPKMMLKRGIEASVVVEFVVYKDGRVTNIRILKPSEHNDFNRASVQAVKDASRKFPRLEKNVRLEIQLDYEINKTRRI